MQEIQLIQRLQIKQLSEYISVIHSHHETQCKCILRGKPVTPPLNLYFTFLGLSFVH